MFYIKANDHTRIEITEDNVFTTCPDCGKEFPIDLMELIRDTDGNLDIYGTQVFCPECSTIQAKKHHAR